MSEYVFYWHLLLISIATLNIVAFAFSAYTLIRKSTTLPRISFEHKKLQLFLSAGYVLGCAYRSYFPVYDVERIALVDSFASSVIVGRSVATFAELCFAAQWAILLTQVSKASQHPFGITCSQWIFSMIVVAELFSWMAVLTTSNIGHVIEEILWGASASLLVANIIMVYRMHSGAMRRFLSIWGTTGTAYVLYMFLVDVPMYWERWLSDQNTGKAYLSFSAGLMDAATRWSISFHWPHWQSEVVWMSLYFSFAVWISMALTHLPAFELSHSDKP